MEAFTVKSLGESQLGFVDNFLSFELGQFGAYWFEDLWTEEYWISIPDQWHLLRNRSFASSAISLAHSNTTYDRY